MGHTPQCLLYTFHISHLFCHVDCEEEREEEKVAVVIAAAVVVVIVVAVVVSKGNCDECQCSEQWRWCSEVKISCTTTQPFTVDQNWTIKKLFELGERTQSLVQFKTPTNITLIA